MEISGKYISLLHPYLQNIDGYYETSKIYLHGQPVLKALLNMIHQNDPTQNKSHL